eukprot:COSAG04_NODE_901_length_9547_cov_3.066469_9_plen_127_part_00
MSGPGITWKGFTEHFRKQEEAAKDLDDETNKMSLVRDIPLPKAVQMVREKIEGVMEGGPDGLRRAFRVFDSNMNGSIDFDEFDQTLKRKLNLRFEHGLLRQVMAAFDDTGDGAPHPDSLAILTAVS